MRSRAQVLGIERRIAAYRYIVTENSNDGFVSAISRAGGQRVNAGVLSSISFSYASLASKPLCTIDSYTAPEVGKNF
jgi:hypothetical protein